MIGSLNGFGHCVSNSVVLSHDTTLAELEMNRGENSLLSIIQPGIPTTLVWDNNDFGESQTGNFTWQMRDRCNLRCLHMYHRTNVLCCKERSPQKKKYSSSKVREENIAVVYHSAMIATTRKVHFSGVLLLPSSWW